MRKFTLKELCQATGGKLIQGDINTKFAGIAIDSRKIRPEQVFFAIIGNKNDAHRFIPQVVESGCSVVVVSDQEAVQGLEVNAVLVEDTTRAMVNLAKYYLDQIPAKKIAVTGSVGKTSTRDMVHAIISSKFKAGKNSGNFNTAYGVSMTVMDFEPDLEAIVLEIGMEHFGEIDALVDLIRPQVGIITNIGVSHIENLGSREGILKSKMEITNYFDESNLLIVNESNDMLSIENTKGNYRLKTAGLSDYDDAFVKDVKDFGDEGIEYTLSVDGKVYDVRLYIPGGHNAINSALAILAGQEFGISVEESIEALQNMELTGKRLTMREGNGYRVIDDTYNACPDSMKSALKSLVASKGERRVAILGDMYELGKDSQAFHREVGEFASKLDGLDVLISVGELGKGISEGAEDMDEVYHFDTKEELYKELDNILKKGDIILVKSSNGLHSDTIVAEILK